jgi:hypothetical protein
MQAIEEVARACKLPYLLLCSTDDPDVKATWRALGFQFSSEEVRLLKFLVNKAEKCPALQGYAALRAPMANFFGETSLVWFHRMCLLLSHPAALF